ncbi:MAG: Rieske 2Fe-2S domain-containing protein [Leptospirales bacterium]
MDAKNWITVMDEGDVAGTDPGEVVAFDIELDSGETLAVGLVCEPNEDSGWMAFENICSHDGEGMEEGEVNLRDCTIECPRHGAKFDVKTGEVLGMPAVTNIRTFDIRILDGMIQLFL